MFIHIICSKQRALLAVHTNQKHLNALACAHDKRSHTYGCHSFGWLSGKFRVGGWQQPLFSVLWAFHRPQADSAVPQQKPPQQTQISKAT